MIKKVFNARHVTLDYSLAQTMLDLIEDVTTYLTSFSNITLNVKKDLSGSNSKMFVFDIDGFDDIHIAITSSGGTGSSSPIVRVGLINTDHIESVTSASASDIFILNTHKSWYNNSGTYDGYYTINDMAMNVVSKNGILKSFTVYKNNTTRSYTDYSHYVFDDGVLVYVYGSASTSYNKCIVDSNTALNNLYILEATGYSESEKAIFKNAEMRSGGYNIRNSFVKIFENILQICNDAFYSTASENLVSVEGVLYRQIGCNCLFIEDGDTE